MTSNILAAMLTLFVLISTCASLLISTSNRLSRVVDKTRFALHTTAQEMAGLRNMIEQADAPAADTTTHAHDQYRTPTSFVGMKH